MFRACLRSCLSSINSRLTTIEDEIGICFLWRRKRGITTTTAMAATTDASTSQATTTLTSTSTSTTATAFTASNRFRVLFCGRDMHFGWQYTRDALSNDDDIECVQCDREEAGDLLPTAHVAVPLMTRLDAGMLARAGRLLDKKSGNLRLVLQYGVGLEGVDLKAAAAAGVAVSNIPSTLVPNALSCAEMSIFLALAALRRAPELQKSIECKRLGAPPGRTLWGKRALIVGFGGIGRALAPRLKALGVTVDAVRRSSWENEEEGEEEDDEDESDENDNRVCPPKPSPSSSSSPSKQEHYDVSPRTASSYLSRRGKWSQLHEFAEQADLVFLCCSENEHTRGVIGDAFWSSAKRGVCLINVARGGLVDPAAALRALKSGAAGALALDVQWEEPVDIHKDDFRGELSRHERVFLTPHVAGVTEESYRGMAEVVAEAARQLARCGRLPKRVLNGPVAGGVG